ncbi:MAG: hypothetical protein ACI9XO_004339 [Paraglaciecola sp.]|jgi:hypothetical protein
MFLQISPFLRILALTQFIEQSLFLFKIEGSLTNLVIAKSVVAGTFSVPLIFSE